ncbi:MAG: FliH/SctL family protein [Nitrospinota bacterium]
MSRIYKKGSSADIATNFKYNSFDDESETSSSKAKEFKSINEDSNVDSNFVRGGFNFSVGDGMRLEEITTRAKVIIDKATADAIKIRESAKQDASKEGFNEGYSAGVKQAEDAIKAISSATLQLNQLRESFYNQAEDEIIDTVIAVSYLVIRQEIKSDRSIVKNIIEEASKLITTQEESIISLNPADFEYVNEIKDRLLNECKHFKRIKIEFDPMIEAGGCTIKSNFGLVDARIESQLEKIGTTLKGASEN